MSVQDSDGNELEAGESVSVIKDREVQGSSGTPKRGTVFENIRLVEDAEEVVECGQGRDSVALKTCFLKKS